MKDKILSQKTQVFKSDAPILNKTNGHLPLKTKEIMGNKTNWLMTAAGAVALVLGIFIYANAVEKELPKKEVIETVAALEMITFTYVAPIGETNPYHEDHVLNPENWVAKNPDCISSFTPNAPCTIEV